MSINSSKIGLTTTNSAHYWKIFNQFVVLAFLNYDHVVAGYNVILASPDFANVELLELFANYFLETWLA